MTRCTGLTAVIILFCALVHPVWGQQYLLYESKPVTDEEKGQTKDGVLVTEVPIQKGDTLYDISRRFSGRGMYYPQILLFNKIKDPNLIYPGSTLKVPVMQGWPRTESAPVKESTGKSKKLMGMDKKIAKPIDVQQPLVSAPKTAPLTELSLSDLKTLDEGKPKKRADKKKVASHGRAGDKKESGKTEHGQSPAGAVAGQKLFEKALKAYRQDDFRSALELFDRYLMDNSNSPLAADASLYKAECYLKLSSQ